MTVKVMIGGASAPPVAQRRKQDMGTQADVIETTAEQVTAELTRRGIAPGQRVTVTIEPDAPNDWITKARRFARAKVIAEGWSDTDIDRLIKEERDAVQPHAG